ncbi:Helicase associated domain protein [Embleya sp. NPDC050493]|uniref:DEAD/DEAH box helicase n=2 Tax=Streptomycetaceae TaxID=2062 RepID=UPI0037B4DA9B
MGNTARTKTAIKLRPHQKEAVQGGVLELSAPPEDDALAELRAGNGPWAGLRAQIIAATGTGKTVIAAATTNRLAPHGRVLVLVPTLDLLTQTVTAWQHAGRTGPMVAVCSLKNDPVLAAAGVRSTTSPPQYTLWTGRQRHITVFGTYASLGVLLEAQEGVYGLEPPNPFSLVVVDEAHRTSGALGKSWAAIHDNRRLPAARRLYLTATPRIWEPSVGSAYAALITEPPVPELDPPDDENDDVDAWDEADLELADELEEDEHQPRTAYQPLPAGLAASMDDHRLYGRVAFNLPLGTAVTRGLVAPFRIFVVEIRDEEVQAAAAQSGSKLNKHTTEPEAKEAYRGKRLAALQTALLKTAAEHDLRRILSFHFRTIEAEAFAKGLPKALKRLRANDLDTYAWTMSADWLSGEHDPGHRRQVLGRFGAGVDTNGVVVDRSFVSNCRVLGEGVDVPEIDTVAILDPKGSIVEIVQAVGRAVRPSVRGDKIATILVPIFLQAGEHRDDMLVSPSWRPLQRVLQALRAHDADIVDVLAVPQVNGTPQSERGPDEPDQDDAAGDGGDDRDGEDERQEWRPILRFSSRRDPVEIARFVEMHVVDPQSRNWLRGLRAAERYRRAHPDLRVPLDGVDVDHHGVKFPLGGWISEQRREYAAGRLNTKQVQKLNGLGMVWSLLDQAWEDGLAIARAYAREHATLAAPGDAVLEGFPIGKWLETKRAQDRKRGLDTARAEALDALVEGEPWNPPHWPVSWQRRLTYASELLAARGDRARLDDVTLDAVHRGEAIGRWIARQKAGWDKLGEEQRAALTGLGLTPPLAAETTVAPVTEGAEPSGRKPKRSREQAFEIALSAAAAYRERVGHLEVPRGHVETVTAFDGWREDVRLGVWITTTRSRRAKLPAERIAALDALGMRWT